MELSHLTLLAGKRGGRVQPAAATAILVPRTPRGSGQNLLAFRYVKVMSLPSQLVRALGKAPALLGYY
jgi:hypothetical protein